MRRRSDLPPSAGSLTLLPSPEEQLPRQVAASIWRGDQLGTPVNAAVPSGWAELDLELPGGGWPCRSLAEILQVQPTVFEWRLVAPGLRALGAGKSVVVVGPPKAPHLPGLRQEGRLGHDLVWIQAETPAERLWVTEQLIKSNACGALLSWLPQARAEQIRRLQVCSQGCDAPVFLFRPATAAQEASAAPLRLEVSFGLDWALQVHILKRKGPVHDGVLVLPSVPGGLEAVLTPRMRQPSRLISSREAADVVGSPAPRRPVVRPIAAH